MRIRALLGVVAVLASSPAGTQSLSPDENQSFFFNGVVEVRQMAVGPSDLPKGSPEACANARIAAKVLADANMGEKLAGIWVEAFRGIGTAGLTNVNTATEELKKTRVPGGDIVKETDCEEFARKGEYWVTVRYASRDVMPVIMTQDRVQLLRTTPDIPGVQPTAPPKPPVKASLSPEAYDGLIVVVPDGFKASIRPVITDSRGRMVFNYAVVNPDIAARVGAAQFTIDTGKARAWLEARGYKHPLTVNGYLHDLSAQAVRVENQDADTILAANAASPFLHSGRVVFVVTMKS